MQYLDIGSSLTTLTGIVNVPDDVAGLSFEWYKFNENTRQDEVLTGIF